MSLADKQARLVAELGTMKNSQERFAYVVRRGREYACLPAESKTEKNRIEGCLAKVWLVERFESGRCYFATDSDSAIVKGIAVILCEFYSGELPADILGSNPSFLEQVGINQHLTPNRRDSLTKIWGRIRAFSENYTGCRSASNFSSPPGVGGF